jgi:hypothetical protein
MGGSSSPSRTTTTQEPPAFIRPFLEDAARASQNLYRAGTPQFFPGQTVVDYDENTRAALEGTRQRAINGSPVVDAAQGYAQRTLNGPVSSQFGSAMNPYSSQPREFAGATNPYLDATFNRAADQVQNRLQSSFAAAGRNTGAARAPAALELNDLANQVYGGAYEQDRNRSLSELQQMRGIGATGFENAQNRALDDIQQQRGLQLANAQIAPQLAAQDYADLSALEGVGRSNEDLRQQMLDSDIERFNYYEQAPQINLDRYLQRITGSFPGGSQTTVTPNTRNRAAGALGGAASLGLAGAGTGNPYLAAGGAVLGGLLGAFGN